MLEEEKKHCPVLLNEILEYLNIQENKTYVDCTLGLGGHSKEILKSLNGTGLLIGLDRDLSAFEIAKENLKEYKNCKLFNRNYINLEEVLRSINLPKIDGGLILDLGVSSLQLDSAERGFSFKNDGPLDMRMSNSIELTAADVVNHYNEEDIADIIYTLGDERFSRRIARAIIKNRPFSTTKQLSDIVLKCYPYKTRSKTHPATKTFQAIRIYVNNELDNIRDFLRFIPELLNQNARLCVISFHSLEDRIIKHFFKDSEDFRLINKKPIIPTKDEMVVNKRARSAKLRVVEKV